MQRVGALIALVLMVAGTDVRAADPERGEDLFRSVCGTCHSLTPARHRTGPSLHKVWMRPIGKADGFRYSAAFEKRSATGDVWDAGALDAFLKKPRKYIRRTRMQFKGFKDPADRAAVIDYLRAQGG